MINMLEDMRKKPDVFWNLLTVGEAEKELRSMSDKISKALSMIEEKKYFWDVDYKRPEKFNV